MKKETIRKFRKIFEAQREKVLFNDRVIREDFAVSADDRYDEIDLATTDIEQSMRMRLRNRETLYIKKIDEALRRIEDGTFGECEDCGEDIEIRRLEARPTATLCVFCKEEQERKEILTALGREHKSLGATFSRKFA
ncbi:MAG: TraR/DksA family transcriptional regulator [Bdellovibrio sp.]|nr:TraR/DksA family transcriptional regulator [Bdellovibrio sp.]